MDLTFTGKQSSLNQKIQIKSPLPPLLNTERYILSPQMQGFTKIEQELTLKINTETQIELTDTTKGQHSFEITSIIESNPTSKKCPVMEKIMPNSSNFWNGTTQGCITLLLDQKLKNKMFNWDSDCLDEGKQNILYSIIQSIKLELEKDKEKEASREIIQFKICAVYSILDHSGTFDGFSDTEFATDDENSDNFDSLNFYEVIFHFYDSIVQLFRH